MQLRICTERCECCLSRPLAVDGLAVPGGEQAPTQGRPPRRSAPDLSAVREGDLSDRLHQQLRRPGDWCALCARSTVSWSALVDRVHGAVSERGSNVAMNVCCVRL